MKPNLTRTPISKISISPVPAAAGRTADTLLLQTRDAAGGAAWSNIRSMHSRLRFQSGGAEGTAEIWNDVEQGRYIERYALGPVQGASGFDGAIAWTQDASGDVRERRGKEREGAVTQAFRSSLAFWYPERWPAQIEYAGILEKAQRQFDVFCIKPQGGQLFELWFDRTTHLIDRIVEKRGAVTLTTLYSDYRSIDGVMLPFAMRSTTGEGRHDQIIGVEEVTLNLFLEENHFQKPKPSPPDYGFIGGRSTTTVNFELINNHIYVPVKLNGRGPHLMIFDTGGANTITQAVGENLELQQQGSFQTKGVGIKSEDMAFARVQKLTLGEVEFGNQFFAILALEDFFHKVEGISGDGIIGYEVLKNLVVNIDYERCRVTLTKPSAFEYSGTGVQVAFSLAGKLPQISGTIDGITGMFSIDTGSRGSLELTKTFVDKHQLEDYFKPRFQALTGWGVGGEKRSKIARGRELHVGDLDISQPMVSLPVEKKGTGSDHHTDGYIGNGLLKRFNLIMHYEKQIIIFEPNAYNLHPDVFDRSGMWLNRSDDVLVIEDITAGGPAEKAGLRTGDCIVAIDGQKVETASLRRLRERFLDNPQGTAICLTINRDGMRDVTLHLEDLL